jgi:hypothetical protein
MMFFHTSSDDPDKITTPLSIREANEIVGMAERLSQLDALAPEEQAVIDRIKQAFAKHDLR